MCGVAFHSIRRTPSRDCKARCHRNSGNSATRPTQSRLRCSWASRLVFRCSLLELRLQLSEDVPEPGLCKIPRFPKRGHESECYICAASLQLSFIDILIYSMGCCCTLILLLRLSPTLLLLKKTGNLPSNGMGFEKPTQQDCMTLCCEDTHHIHHYDPLCNGASLW